MSTIALVAVAYVVGLLLFAFVIGLTRPFFTEGPDGESATAIIVVTWPMSVPILIAAYMGIAAVLAGRRLRERS